MIENNESQPESWAKPVPEGSLTKPELKKALIEELATSRTDRQAKIQATKILRYSKIYFETAIKEPWVFDDNRIPYLDESTMRRILEIDSSTSRMGQFGRFRTKDQLTVLQSVIRKHLAKLSGSN